MILIIFLIGILILFLMILILIGIYFNNNKIYDICFEDCTSCDKGYHVEIVI